MWLTETKAPHRHMYKSWGKDKEKFDTLCKELIPGFRLNPFIDYVINVINLVQSGPHRFYNRGIDIVDGWSPDTPYGNCFIESIEWLENNKREVTHFTIDIEGILSNIDVFNDTLQARELRKSDRKMFYQVHKNSRKDDIKSWAKEKIANHAIEELAAIKLVQTTRVDIRNHSLYFNPLTHPIIRGYDKNKIIERFVYNK